jgi:chromosome segregation ATPase
MPTNQEWLHKLANESPDELKAWFDAEHNDNLAAEKVVSGDAAHSNDGNAHLKASEDLSDAFSDSREKLESEVRTIAAINEVDGKGRKLFEDMIINMLDRQAGITERQYEERVANIERQIGAIKAANDNYREEVDRLQRRNDELRTSYDKLKRERDNLADDLLTCNREREQLREHLGIALDHAHDICSLVDIDGNVLDVGD